MPDTDATEDCWNIVKNQDGHHSIWPARNPVPEGWSIEGPALKKDECLDEVERRWTDLRPDVLKTAGS